MKRLEEGFLSRLFTNVDVGVDLGTSNLLIFLPERGIVYREPSMVAIDKTNGKVVAVGRRAKEMLGKTPDRIDVVQPLAGGVVATMKRLRHAWYCSRTGRGTQHLF